MAYFGSILFANMGGGGGQNYFQTITLLQWQAFSGRFSVRAHAERRGKLANKGCTHQKEGARLPHLQPRIAIPPIRYMGLLNGPESVPENRGVRGSVPRRVPRVSPLCPGHFSDNPGTPRDTF